MFLTTLLTPVCRGTFSGVVSGRQAVPAAIVLLAEVVPSRYRELAEFLALGDQVASLLAIPAGCELCIHDCHG